MDAAPRQPYRVAIVGGSLSTAAGGAPRSMARHAHALQTQGVRVTLFVGHSRKYPLTPEQFHLRDCEIVASRLWGPSVLGLAVGALRALRRRAREFRVIHLNGAWNLTTFTASRIAVAQGVPYIISCRSHLGAYHYSRYRLIKPVLYALFESRNIRDAAAMHVTSDWEQETSRPLLGNARVVKVPNAVDLTDFAVPISRAQARDRLSLPPTGFLAVCLGRMARQKNPEFLVDAFAATNPKAARAILVFVGPPEKRLKAALQRRISGLRLDDHIRFVDFAEGKERRDWLAAADLFVLPSFDENFCIAAIEAAASGTHCLLSPHVGAVEYLPRDSATVLTLDKTQWVRALTGFYAAPPPQRAMPAGVCRQFAPETVGRQWMEVYRQVLG